MDVDRPVVADLVAQVATAVSRRAAEVSQDVCKLILREIPQLDDDRPVVALLASSVDSNVATCLQILQHQIDLTAVGAPASALTESLIVLVAMCIRCRGSKRSLRPGG